MGVLDILFNGIYFFTSKINEKIRNRIIGLVLIIMLAMPFFHFMRKNFFVEDFDEINSIIQFVLMILLLIFSINDRSKCTVKIVRPFFFITWGLSTLFMVIASISHPVGKGVFLQVVEMFVLIPLIALVWNHRNGFNWLFSLISKIYLSLLAVSFIMCLMAKPILLDGGALRYNGFSYNCNYFAFFCAIGILCALYLIYTECSNYVLYFIMLVFSCGMLFYTAARASMLGATLGLVVATCFYFKKNLISNSKIIKKIIVIGCIILAILVSPTVTFNSINAVSSYTEEAYAVTESKEEYQDEIENNLHSRLDLEGKDFNAITSGRYDIWKVYWSHLKAFGCNTEVPIQFERYGHQVSAHNVFIQYAYMFGIISVVFYLLFMVGSMVYCVRDFFRKKLQPYHMFTAMMVFCYFGVGMFEAVYIPMKHIVGLMFFFSIMPLLFKNEVKTNAEVIEYREKKYSRRKGKH